MMTDRTSSPETRARALTAYDAGICVIPIKSDGSKAPPKGLGWKRYQYERPSREQVEEWFGPYQAFAVICGEVSGGLLMLEMEGRFFEEGLWQRFRDEVCSRIPEDRWREIAGYVELSPSGGPHIFVRCPGHEYGNVKLAKAIRPNPETGELEPQDVMETRGEGGYSVAAGSVGHKSGRAWTIAKGGSIADVATVTPDELEAILAAARMLDEVPAPEPEPERPRPPRRETDGDSWLDDTIADFNAAHDALDLLGSGWSLFCDDTYRGERVDRLHRAGSDNDFGAVVFQSGRIGFFSSNAPAGCNYYDGKKLPTYDQFTLSLILAGKRDTVDDRVAYALELRKQGYGPPFVDRKSQPFEPDWDALGVPETRSGVDDATPAGDEGQSEDTGKSSSWTPVDLDDALEGVDVNPPAWWRRSDGTPLVYSGRTHWFQGPSESLKSMAAQMLVAEVLEAGAPVLYIDFEDDDRGVVARLLSMGVAPGCIRALLTYVRPDEALQDRHGKWTPGGLDYLRLLEQRPEVVILDGVTEAMTTEGMDLLDNGDTARWMRLLPKRLADTGAAVVVIDHTTKNAESAGRHAIGAQHKLAGVTGATYKFEVVRPLARAVLDPVTGQVKVTVTKDRPGWVRGRCEEGQVGLFEVTSYPDGGLTAAMMAPGAESQAVDLELVGEILTHLATYEGATGRHIEAALDVKATRVRGAIKAAIGRGWIRVQKVGSSHQHHLTDQGREVMK